MSSDEVNKDRLSLVLTRYNNWESEAEKEEYIDTLEELIGEFNSNVNNGKELVPDSVYDFCMDTLRVLKPDTKYLHILWSEDDDSTPFNDDIDKFLVSHQMMSIQTIKNMSEKPVSEFRDKLPNIWHGEQVTLCASIKENGHGIRVIWKDGNLVKSTSRGRSTNGKDLTNQARLILGDYNEYFATLGVVEMRGEALLPFRNLKTAREYNSGIKSAFSGVASMIRDSATEEETKLLDIVFYDIYYDGADFDTLESKFNYIRDCGFIVPYYFTKETSRGTFYSDLDSIVSRMDSETTSYDYYTDGVVVAINDIELFNMFGAEDRLRLGNLALKVGRWKQDGYSGIVKEIKWVDGKSKKTPVAVLEDGVMTLTGNTVTNIPLYAPLYILMLEAYPGNIVYFKYGGEAGVVPLTKDGKLVTSLGL